MFFLLNSSHHHQFKSLALQVLGVSDSHINAKMGIILKSSYSHKSNFLKKKSQGKINIKIFPMLVSYSVTVSVRNDYHTDQRVHPTSAGVQPKHPNI